MGLAAVVPEVPDFLGAPSAQRDDMLVAALRGVWRAMGTVAGLIDAADRTGVYGEDGHGSPQAWLRAAGNMSRADAAEMVATARTLGALDATADAFVAGGLGSSQLRELVRLYRSKSVRASLVEHEELMLGYAQTFRFDDFEKACRHFRAVSDPDGTHRSHARAEDARKVSTGFVGEEFVLHATTGADAGAKIIKVLDEFTRREFEADMSELHERCGENAPTILMRRTHTQRRADALLKIFETAATAAGVVAPGEALVDYVVDERTWTDTVADATRTGHGAGRGSSGTEGTGGTEGMSEEDLDVRIRRYRCHTDNGVDVDPMVIFAHALNGRIRRVVTDPRGVPVDVGRRQRFFDGPLRDVLRSVFDRCLHPGCDVPADQCQIDHLDGYNTHGGATRTMNAGPLCGKHNRWKHDHGYQVWLDPGGQWHVHRPDGTEIAPRDHPPPTAA